jgi:hypothetical protein
MKNRIGTLARLLIKAVWSPKGHPFSNKNRRAAGSSMVDDDPLPSPVGGTGWYDGTVDAPAVYGTPSTTSGYTCVASTGKATTSALGISIAATVGAVFRLSIFMAIYWLITLKLAVVTMLVVLSLTI